ncbi:hypothetical protein RB195_015031 [Necator americanus]|uniref:RhoGEF domain protein n=1 Tax=Necator americanus TaxID=51031 RepID=A0ABR1E2V8_NECAM
MAWFRKRFSYYESLIERCPTDEEPTIKLRGYRTRPDDPSVDKERQHVSVSDYENLQEVKEYVDTMSSCSMESSVALSADSTLTLTERDTTPTPVNGLLTRTPVLRRRRSNIHTNLRRNYRIMAPDESIQILKQQSGVVDDQQQQHSQRSKILRRKSSRREKDIINPPPMVITPPVLLNRVQSCSLCCREKSCPSDAMPPTSLTSARFSEEDPARLSFVSSSTGYSSARSSLRSSDGGEDNSNNRDSGIVSLSSLSSLSSSRRSTLLSAGSLSHVDRIAIELFDTEKSYVEDLYAVIQGYLNFLVDHRDELGVTLDNISSLFGCIERIYAFNRKLLQQLDLADLDCVKMSRCFVDSAGKFEDYIVYCTNYHRMIATLSQLQQQPHLAAALSQRQAALGHALPLSAYLLKPVQRVLKYHLFIENMLKHLPSSIPPDDFAVVKRAHEVMTSQASRINDEKKRAEHAERVEQLQAAIQKWTVDKQTANLSAYGELLLEAQFRQAGSKTTRLLFLFEEMLLIVKQRNSNYVCKDYIMSSNLMLNESIYPEEPLAFQVLSFDNPRTQYIFLASSADQKRTWMIELKRMMLDHYGIEIPEKTKQLMLSMDNTQRVAFGRPEFAEVSLKNHKRVPKYLEKRRKSVDKGTSDQNRRRSLSASRLLGASKTSLVSDSSRYKLFGVPDVVPKCTCHMSTTPGPSNGPVSNRVSAVSKVPVSRTLSASTIFFDGSLEGAQSAPAKEAVLSSRSRYHMARNKRALPPKCETRSPSIRRIECEEIDETFNELFKELVSCGNASPKTQARQAVAVAPNSSEQDSLQEVMAYREQAVYKNRSKSLTRLDEFCDPSIDLLLNGDVAESFTPSELYEQERHFNRGDQMKRGRAKKYHMSGDSEMLRGGCGRIPLSDRAATIAEVDSPRGDFPLIDDDVVSPRKLAARQRTPLTVEQAAELDALIPVGGVVKTLIRQIENTGS